MLCPLVARALAARSRGDWPRASTASALDSSLCSCQGCTSPKLLPTRTEHSRRTGTDPWLWDRALLEQVTSTWKFCLFLLNSSFFPQLQHSFAPLLLFSPLFLSQASLTEFSLCQLQTNTVSKTKFFQEINEELEKYQKFTSPYIMRRAWKTCKQNKEKQTDLLNDRYIFLKDRPCRYETQKWDIENQDKEIRKLRRCMKFNCFK